MSVLCRPWLSINSKQRVRNPTQFYVPGSNVIIENDQSTVCSGGSKPPNYNRSKVLYICAQSLSSLSPASPQLRYSRQCSIIFKIMRRSSIIHPSLLILFVWLQWFHYNFPFNPCLRLAPNCILNTVVTTRSPGNCAILPLIPIILFVLFWELISTI